MPQRHKVHPRVKYILVWIGIFVTFFFAIFPELLVDRLGFAHVNPEIASKIFSGINAILLTLLAFIQVSLRRSLSLPAAISSLGKPLPSIASQDGTRNSAPLSILVIFSGFSSFQESQLVEIYLKQIAILANFKPLIIKDEHAILPVLKDRAVKGIIADEKCYERLIHHVSDSHATLLGFYPHPHFVVKEAGTRKSIGIPELNLENRLLASRVAKAIVGLHGPDTPGDVGFRGNWIGTYGLMNLKQDDDFEVEGRY